MIITVDPSQSEDIAAFAMVKQYRMQALNVTLNGGTGSSAWQAVQGGEGYTQTVVTPVTGIELVYEDPNAIVSYTVENDDTSNYDAASNAGIILSSIEPTTNAWTYTCVFHADSVPVSSVDIDLLVYGNIARGTEQQGSPATAEEITVQVLARLETRVTALEEEMPTKADVATTYTKTEIDNSVVKLTGNQTITGLKTIYSFSGFSEVGVKSGRTNDNIGGIGFFNGNGTRVSQLYAHTNGNIILNTLVTGGAIQARNQRAYDPNNPTAYVNDVVTFGNLGSYPNFVKTTDNQTIDGVKTFKKITWATALGIEKGICGPATASWGNIYLMATIDSLPSNDGCVFTIRGGLNNQNHLFAKYRVFNASSGGLAIEAIEKAYSSQYQEPHLYVYNDGGTINIYGTTLSWTSPRLYLDYWETQGYMYADLNRHNLTVSSNFSTVTLPEGALAEVPTYPIENTVHKTGAESIAGAKTFTEAINAQSTLPALNLRNTFGVTSSTPSSNYWDAIYFKDKNGANEGLISFAHYTSGNKDIFLQLNAENGVDKYFHLFANNDGTSYATAPNRGYDSNNASTYANDVVTFTSLGAYTPMVRTTGNQEISGIKKLNNYVDYGSSVIDTSSYKWVKFCETSLVFNYQDRNLIFAFLPRHSDKGIQLINIGTRYNVKATLLTELTANRDERYAFAVRFDTTNNKIQWFVKSDMEMSCAVYPMMGNYLGSVMTDGITNNPYSSATGLKFHIYPVVTEYTNEDMTYIY
jgi:hypothetical protein